jgi:acyl-CoA thioesterase FadM
MQRQFRHTYVVRYDDCDCFGFLTPAAFLRYMQDVAGLDAEGVQFTGDGFWIVKRSQIAFAAPVPLHTPLEVTTYALSFARITAQRGYEARIAGNPESEPVVKARTQWVYVDKNGRPKRIPEGSAELWLPDGPQAPLPETPFAPLPERAPEVTTARVRFSDIDFMQHLNNAAAVDLLDNAAWEAHTAVGMTPTSTVMHALSYDIEYVASTLLGEQVEIQSWFDPLPATEQEVTRTQQMTRDGRVIVRAYSRWACHLRESHD